MKKKNFLLKIVSLIFVVSLTLCAANKWIYVLAIFIIATGVTKLDFLLKLAAIFRGGEGASGYFEYLKNVSYASDVLKEEMGGTGEEIERVEKERKKEMISKLQDLAPWALEELVLRYLERRYNTVIKRQVKIRNFVLDGVMALDSKRDAIIEVKIFRKISASLFKIITSTTLPRLVDVAKHYRTTYGRDVVIFLVFVISKEVAPILDRLLKEVEQISNRCRSEGIEIRVEIFNLDDLEPL